MSQSSGARFAVAGKLLQCGPDLAKHDRIPGRAIDRLVGQAEQAQGAETRRQALEPGGGDHPVRVAAGTAHEIGLPLRTFDEGSAQFGDEGRITSDRGCEGSVEGSGIIGHDDESTRRSVNASFPLAFPAHQKLLRYGMTMGAKRADAQPEGSETEIHEAEWSVVSMSGDYSATQAWPEEVPVRSATGARLLAGLLLLLACGWIVAAGWMVRQSGEPLTLQTAVTWIPLVSAPLALLAVLWLMLGRTSRHETEHFTRAVASMRNESAALESLLSIIATRLEENHARLTSEAAKLMSLGDEAADRLGRVAHYLSKESANLDRRSDALENAAAAARVDIGVLLSDLPRAEEQARAVAEAMKQAGLGAHEQAAALEGQLSSLVARGREADEIAGGAAQRLAAHLARIESTAASASSRMDEAAASMQSAIDDAMARAAEAIDTARAGLEAQGNAMLAMIEQSRAALESAGEESGRNLGQRLETLASKIGGLAEHLAAQDAASHALVSGLSKELAELDQRFLRLSETGLGGTERLEASVAAVRGAVGELAGELDSGSTRAGDLISRVQELGSAASQLKQQFDEALPAALERVEEQAGRTQTAANRIVPDIESIRNSADLAASRVSEAEQSLVRQQEQLDQLLARISAGLGTAQEQLHSLGVAAGEADDAARRIVADTGPELIESLLRVRDTAQQAAEHARAAIAEVIPSSAAALGEASKEAVVTAVSGTVSEQLGVLTEMAEKAVAAARRASDRLTRQMLTIGKTTAAIEARIEETQREREEEESKNLSRRVALLIESLNSTAIDVTKILSNEVTDTAWAAYLRGDRGVFTRRAVRLLNSGEAREIARHYEEEPEFREQVNRYIHDFEAMLRRILADRDGSPLGVTILSSDMGKLYVALAQAIERLR